MNVDGVRDPFAGQNADRLGFLSSRSPVPAGTIPMLRGTSRLFEPTRRTGANEAAEVTGVAQQPASAGQMGEGIPRPDSVETGVVSTATNLFGLDLGSLSVEELGRLMTACATEMMRAAIGSTKLLEP